MRKRLTILPALLLAVFLLSGCGHNPIMYKHLSTPENYTRYDVTLCGIYWYDAEGSKHESAADSVPTDASTVYLKVIFSSKEELAPFVGFSAENLTKTCEEYPIDLKITGENHKILYENGFYEAVSMNTVMTVTSSNWIYMDGRFFYVVAVTYDGVEYLDQATGLSNTIAMMDQQRSVL